MWLFHALSNHVSINLRRQHPRSASSHHRVPFPTLWPPAMLDGAFVYTAQLTEEIMELTTHLANAAELPVAVYYWTSEDPRGYRRQKQSVVIGMTAPRA